MLYAMMKFMQKNYSIFPSISAKSPYPLIFLLEHLLQALYSADAPGINWMC